MASSTPELPNAGKWFNGFIDVTRWIKDIGTILRIIVIIVVAYILFVGAIALWKKWIPAPKKKTPTTIESVNCTNGKCEISSGDKTSKFGVITF